MFGKKEKKQEEKGPGLFARLTFIGKVQQELDHNDGLSDETRAQLTNILQEQAELVKKDVKTKAVTALKVVGVGAVIVLVAGGAIYFLSTDDEDADEQEQAESLEEDNSVSDNNITE